MPGQNIIEVGFDVPKVEGQKEAIIGYLQEVANEGKKLDGVKFSFGSVTGMEDFKKANEELKTVVKELTTVSDNYNNALKTQAQSTKAATEAAKQQTEASKQSTEDKKQETEQSKQQTEAQKQATEQSKQSATIKVADAKASSENAKQKDIETKTTIALTREQERQAKASQQKADTAAKASAKEEKAIEDLSNDYKQLSLAYNEAALRAKNLALQQGSNTPAAKAALAEANALREKLYEVDSLTGTFNRNVGNYGNAIAQSFSKAFGYIRQAAYILPGIGIAGIFTLAFDAIGKVVEALGFFDTATEKAAEKQRKFNDIKREELDIDKQIEDVEKSRLNSESQTNKTTQSRENALNIAKEENLTKAEQLRLEKELADAKALQANQAFNEKGGFDREQQARAALIAAQQQLKDRESELKDIVDQGSVSFIGTPTEADKDAVEKQKQLVDDAKKNVSDQIKVYQEVKGINEDNANALVTQKQKEIEINTYAAAQNRKLILDSTKLQQDLIKDSNGKILADQRSTLDKRIEAIKSNLSAQKQIIQAELNNVLNDPSSSDVDKKLAAQKSSAETIKATRDRYKQEYDTRLEFFNRSLQASKEAQKIELEQTAKFNEDEFNNVAQGLQKRLQSQVSFSDRQKDLIILDYNYQHTLLTQKASTDEEYKLLEASKDAKLVQLAFDSQKKITEIYKTEGDNRQHIQEQFYQFILKNNQSDLDNADKYNTDVQALNKSLQAKTVSIQQYEKQRKDIQETYDNERLQSAIDKEKSIIAQKKLSNESTLDDEIKLDELISQKNAKSTEKQLSDAKQIAEAKKFLHEEEIRLARESAGLIISLFENQIEVQKNKLAYIQNIKDEGYAKDLENVRSSSLSEQDKAAQTIQIQARQIEDKKKYDLEQKQLDIKKAEFAKASAALNIIAATAVAEVQALTYLSNPITAPFYPGISATIAAIGAVELATILAAPIPKYAEGTEDHPGGFAIVGEGKHKELVEVGGKSFIADKPMLLDLPKHARVTPIGTDEMNAVMYRAMAGQMSYALMAKETGNQDMKRLISAIEKGNKQQVGINVTGNRPFQEWNVWVKNITNW